MVANETAPPPKEKRSGKQRLLLIATNLLSIVCLAWVLHGIDWREFPSDLREINWWWITLAISSDVIVSPLENMFGVRFIATGVPVEEIDKTLKPDDLPLVARTRDAYVYENPFALPRVLLVGDWKLANFDELLRTGRWPDFDPSRSVLLERAPRPAFPPSAEEIGAARIVSYRNDEVVVETDAKSSAILVLNDVWHPWWRATLDGAPVDIQKANLLFRGIAVPPGKHTVRFTFHPVGGALAELWEKVSGRPR